MEEGIHYCVLDPSLCVCGRRQLSIAPEVVYMDFMCSKEVPVYMDFMCSKEVPVYMFNVARRN